MSLGCFAQSSLWPRPSLSRAPGLKFSVTTSDVEINLEINSKPSLALISTARLFLLRLNTGKNPAPACCRRRVLSPSSGSTLMTSAPRSASTSPQVGPMTMCANSTTRTPSSGSTESLGNAGEGHVPVDLLIGQRGDHHLPRFEQLV